METITFSEFDKLNRKEFADRLTKVIGKFSQFYDEAFVLSLNAKFGEGKTTFLQMWEQQLVNDDGFSVIRINAWETDFDEEPLIPIISAILEKINDGHSDKLRAALNNALGTVALIGNTFLDRTLGVDVKGVMEDLEADNQKSNIQALGEALYTGYSYKKNAYDELRNELKDYVEKIQIRPLVIMVDELDRVRPDYSVKFLEAIKHIFSVRGICFVLAVDRSQLEASIRQLYGKIDFENYYRKFITREAPLPNLSHLDLSAFVSAKASKYLGDNKTIDINFPFDKALEGKILNFISVISQVFSFTPRQMESLLRIFIQLMSVSTKTQDIKETWVFVSIILIAIYIHNRTLYTSIGNSSASVPEIFEYLKSLNFKNVNKSYGERYFVFNVLAFYMESGKPNQLKEIATRCLGYQTINSNSLSDLDKLNDQMINHLARIFDDFGDVPSTPKFQKIYSRIEEWKEFF